MTTDTPASSHSRRRPVVFQHVRTGRLIAASSVAEFARKAKLGTYGQYQYDNVLKGHRLHVRGWGLPERLNQHLDVKDVWGNRWSGTVNDLRCKLSACAVNRLARGQAAQLVLPASAPLPKATRRPLRYTAYAVRRGGRVYKGRTLGEVAAKAGVSIGPIWSLVHGVQTRTRCGLKLERVEAVRRSAFA